MKLSYTWRCPSGNCFERLSYAVGPDETVDPPPICRHCKASMEKVLP